MLNVRSSGYLYIVGHSSITKFFNFPIQNSRKMKSTAYFRSLSPYQPFLNFLASESVDQRF